MLKQLIQRLLDSRTTPEEAGHSAMPTTTEITSQSFAGPFSSWGPVASGTASEDGYIYAAGAVATSGSNSEFRLDNGQFGSYITSTWGTQGLLLPVMKGQFWRLYAANRKDVVIRLYRLVGGGYKGFIRRALSCLRPSFNFSLKNSLLAEATGFPTNPIQLFKRRISHLQRQESGFLSSLLATGGSASKGLPRKFCLATGRFGRGAIQQRHLIKAFVFLSQKAGLWPTYYRQTPRAHMSSLFRVSAINSFQTGGALC